MTPEDFERSLNENDARVRQLVRDASGTKPFEAIPYIVALASAYGYVRAANGLVEVTEAGKALLASLSSEGDTRENGDEHMSSVNDTEGHKST